MENRREISPEAHNIIVWMVVCCKGLTAYEAIKKYEDEILNSEEIKCATS